MALTRVDTEHFSDVEVAARSIAQSVSDLKTIVASSRSRLGGNWDGEGRREFDNLSYVIERQMKDISDEFWDVYETLVDAEGAFLEADQAVATEVQTIGDQIREGSYVSDKAAATGAAKIGGVAAGMAEAVAEAGRATRGAAAASTGAVAGSGSGGGGGGSF